MKSPKSIVCPSSLPINNHINLRKMTIEINNSKTVREIQDEFSKKFPYLKLEFFTSPHAREAASHEIPCRPEKLLGELRESDSQGIITITPGNETGAVEKEFEDRFGLNVQIYRLQMDRWIQTVGTDILTLKEQNEIAKDSAIFYNPDHQLSRE